MLAIVETHHTMIIVCVCVCVCVCRQYKDASQCHCQDTGPTKR